MAGAIGKLFVGGIIGAGILAMGSFFKKFKSTAANLQTNTTVKVQKLNLSGITLRVDVQIKNPTSMKFSIKYPFIRLIYPAGSTTVIGSSQVIDRDITIPAYGEAVADKIMIEIPATSLLSIGSDLITSFMNGNAVKMTVKTITTIDIGVKKIGFEKTEILTINLWKP
jgi:hypothetical protein